MSIDSNENSGIITPVEGDAGVTFTGGGDPIPISPPIQPPIIVNPPLPLPPAYQEITNYGTISITNNFPGILFLQGTNNIFNYGRIITPSEDDIAIEYSSGATGTIYNLGKINGLVGYNGKADGYAVSISNDDSSVTDLNSDSYHEFDIDSPQVLGFLDDSINYIDANSRVVFGTKEDDLIEGNDKSQIIFGGKGDDWILAQGGNDKVFGGKGNDVISGGEGRDILFGGKGDDWIFGGEGRDYLKGGSGNDVLLGGAGNDRLKGGKGDDILQGGAGRDKLKGGQGEDSFKFNSISDSTSSNRDLITDFTQGEDVIDFSNIEEIDSFDDITINQHHGKTFISANDNDFELKLSGLIDLNDSDFVW